MYHFIIIFLGNVFEPLIQKIFIKINLDRENKVYRVFRSIKVFVLVVIGELIFRAPTVTIATEMIKKIFTNFNITISELSSLGLDIPDYLVLFVSILLVLVISILKENNINIRKEIEKQNIIIRWIIFYILIFSIIIFGAYGVGYQPIDPIYADF